MDSVAVLTARPTSAPGEILTRNLGLTPEQVAALRKLQQERAAPAEIAALLGAQYPLYQEYMQNPDAAVLTGQLRDGTGIHQPATD